jgi:hypothetical protein
MTAYWDIAPCSFRAIGLVMEAVCTSETSVHFNKSTQRYIPEGCLVFIGYSPPCELQI